jgi:hypothetical protein
MTPHPSTPRLEPGRRRQIFRPTANVLARGSIAFGLLAIVGLFYFGDRAFYSAFRTDANVPIRQPIPFSHQHHSGGLGISCLYCHTSVQESAFAGLPPTQTCMSCHSQIWLNAPMLEPVRQSYDTGVPITWNGVNDLPDYVHFNHSIHVNNGIGCTSCHGKTAEQQLVAKAQPLTMEWCLDCHRAPEQYLRESDDILNQDWLPASNQAEVGERLLQEYQINKERLTNCSTCHR